MPRDPLPPLTPDPIIEFYKKDVDRTLLVKFFAVKLPPL
jgi:hypothetical protein